MKNGDGKCARCVCVRLAPESINIPHVPRARVCMYTCLPAIIGAA